MADAQASGAMSGAAAGTSIAPGWGTAIGAVLGGLSGTLGGMGARRRQRAEQLANQRLNRAMRLYGLRAEQLSGATVGGARAIDDQYQAALRAHLAGQPDLAAQLPGRVGAAQAQFQQAGAPALQPMQHRGGGQQAYVERLAADTQRRFSDTTSPLAAQAGAAQSAMSDEDYRRMLATQLASFQPQIRNLGTLQALQQARDFEELSAAKNQYGGARQRAATAGTNQLLQGQLLQAGGAGFAGLFMGGQPSGASIVQQPGYVNPQIGTFGAR